MTLWKNLRQTVDAIRLADISFGGLSFYQEPAEDSNEANAFVLVG